MLIAKVDFLVRKRTFEAQNMPRYLRDYCKTWDLHHLLSRKKNLSPPPKDSSFFKIQGAIGTTDSIFSKKVSFLSQNFLVGSATELLHGPFLRIFLNVFVYFNLVIIP